MALTYTYSTVGTAISDLAGVPVELMTINVSPATQWAVGDTITGQASSVTSIVAAYVSATTYYVRARSGTYTSGEIIGVTGDAAKLADQNAGCPSFTTGSLTASTTYYYIVKGVKTTGYDVTWGSGSTSYTSLASNEITITTDTTKKSVNLTWSAMAGAAGYIVYRSLTSGVYTEALTTGAMVTATSYNDTGVATASSGIWYPHVPNGAGKIIVTGTGTFTMTDLYAQSGSCGSQILKLAEDNYEILCPFELNANGVIFSTKNETITINGYFMNRLGQVQAGEVASTYSYLNGSIFIFKRLFAAPSIHAGSNASYPSYYYDCTFTPADDGLDNPTTKQVVLTTYTANYLTLVSCKINGFRGVHINGANSVYKQLLFNSSKTRALMDFAVQYPTSTTTTIDSLFVSGYNCAIELDQEATGNIKNCALQGNTYDIGCYRLCTSPSLIDTTYTNVKMYRSGPYFPETWEATRYESGSVNVKYTYQCKVVDEQNNIIPFAVVNITNLAGTTTAPLAGPTGEITATELPYKTYSYPIGSLSETGITSSGSNNTLVRTGAGWATNQFSSPFTNYYVGIRPYSASSSIYETNTATSGGNNTLTRTGAGWTTNQFTHATQKYYVSVRAGSATAEQRLIVSNNSNTLTVTPNWTTNPANTDAYSIGLLCEQKLITSNTPDTLTISGTWTVNPADGTVYQIGLGAVTYYNDTGTTRLTETLYYPYTISVTKPGYQPFIGKFTNDKKMYDTIVLKPITSNNQHSSVVLNSSPTYVEAVP